MNPFLCYALQAYGWRGQFFKRNDINRKLIAFAVRRSLGAGGLAGQLFRDFTVHYVYIIQSLNLQDQIYVGCTEDLKKRLSNHNTGTTPHTAKYLPWKLIFYAGFENKFKAYEFEKFLKSGSGREFRNKRLL